ncbi:MAG: polysaccharide deacetylase family protein [Candidatus Binatia bacterium]
MPRRSPIEWPGKAKIAINLLVSWETWPEDLGTPSSHQRSNRGRLPEKAVFKKDMGVVMDREYGEKVGIWRLLDLFDTEAVKATFFLNGKTVEENSEAASEIVKRDHEIASQTYIHEYPVMFEKEAERKTIQQAVESFNKVLGVKPLGYLSPGVRPTPNTLELIAEEGFLWSSDSISDDLPYPVKVNDKTIIMIPKDWHPNDYTTYDVDARAPREVLGLLLDAFDYLYEEGVTSPKLITVSIHPYLSGRPYRAKVLRDFIRYAKSHPNVWFARGIDIVNWWRERYC